MESAKETITSQYLSKFDTIGINQEYSLFKRFQSKKLGKYLTFHNSWIPHLWKRERGHRVDFIFTVGDYKIYVENKHCEADYPIRTQWYLDSVKSRFQDCHIADKFHIHVLLTNKPKNYNSVLDLAQADKIQICGFSQLEQLIQLLLTSQYTTTHNSTINHSITITNNQRVTSISYSDIREFIVEYGKILKREESERLRKLYNG